MLLGKAALQTFASSLSLHPSLSLLLAFCYGDVVTAHEGEPDMSQAGEGRKQFLSVPRGLEADVVESCNWEMVVKVLCASRVDFLHAFCSWDVCSGHTVYLALSSSFQILCWLAEECAGLYSLTLP